MTESATTLVLLRHGVTEHTVRRVFCGSGGTDPALTAQGRRQALRAGQWIGRQHDVAAVIASPLRRTRETADVVDGELGVGVRTEEGLAETAFGEWDGHTFAEIMSRWPQETDAWLASSAVAPPGGESFDAVDERVSVVRRRVVDEYAGRTVVLVSHVTPIKLIVRETLAAPVTVLHSLELAPASISTVTWYADGRASLRNFSVVPDADLTER